MSTSPRRRRLRRWLIGIAVAVALYAVAGFFIVPWLARTQIEKRGSAALAREVTVGEVWFTRSGSLWRSMD